AIPAGGNYIEYFLQSLKNNIDSSVSDYPFQFTYTCELQYISSATNDPSNVPTNTVIGVQCKLPSMLGLNMDVAIFSCLDPDNIFFYSLNSLTGPDLGKDSCHTNFHTNIKINTVTPVILPNSLTYIGPYDSSALPISVSALTLTNLNTL